MYLYYYSEIMNMITMQFEYTFIMFLLIWIP